MSNEPEQRHFHYVVYWSERNQDWVIDTATAESLPGEVYDTLTYEWRTLEPSPTGEPVSDSAERANYHSHRDVLARLLGARIEE